MTREQAEQLKLGDVVFWDDPDGGLCSRLYTISAIAHGCDDSDPTVILDFDGSEIGCYPEELSKVDK